MTSTASYKANPEAARWNSKYNSSSTLDIDIVPQGETELVIHDAILQKSGLALEVACGKGKNAMYLATRGYDVIACDIAFSGLVQCLSVVGKAGLSVYPLVCDVTKYAMPANKFELVSVVRYLERVAPQGTGTQ